MWLESTPTLERPSCLCQLYKWALAEMLWQKHKWALWWLDSISEQANIYQPLKGETKGLLLASHIRVKLKFLKSCIIANAYLYFVSSVQHCCRTTLSLSLNHFTRILASPLGREDLNEVRVERRNFCLTNSLKGCYGKSTYLSDCKKAKSILSPYSLISATTLTLCFNISIVILPPTHS